MKKKIIIAILALVLVFTFTSKADAQTFKDINGHWAKEYIEWATDNGIFTGYKDGTFKPDKKISVAEFIKIISNIKGLEYNGTYISFIDVRPTEWYRPALEDLVGLGLIKDGEYLYPDKEISRDEAFGLLGQLFPYKEQVNKLEFSDNFTIKRHRDIGILKDMGLVSGDTHGRINAYKGISRAEVATILYNMNKNYIEIDNNELARAREEHKFDFNFNSSFSRDLYNLYHKKLMDPYTYNDAQIDELFRELDRQSPGYTYHKDEKFYIDPNNLITDLYRVINESPDSMFLKRFSVSRKYPSDDMKFSFEYKVPQEDARTIASTIISIKQESEGKSDFEKVKIIHDWIVNNTRYAYDEYQRGSYDLGSGIDAHDKLAIFKYGKGVCQAYAETFNLLAREVGLGSILIRGEGYSFDNWGGHAWNIVNVDGKLYHIDTTWDDPISYDGRDILRYDYFLIDDDTMSKNHRWDRSAYPVVNDGCLNQDFVDDRNSNYYYYYD